MDEKVQDIETARLSEGLNILGEVRHKHAIRTCAEIRVTLDQIIARDDLRESVWTANERYLTLAHTARNRFLQRYCWTGQKLEIFTRKVLQIRTKFPEGRADENVDRNLPVRTPPPCLAQIQKRFPDISRDCVENVHRQKLVIRVLDNSNVMHVKHRPITQVWMSLKNFGHLCIKGHYVIFSMIGLFLFRRPCRKAD